MAKELFSKKSMERVSSPEELNDYIKVSNPSIWIILAAILFFLLGVGIWSIAGHLDTIIKTGAISKDGNVTCYIKESDIDMIDEGFPIKINGNEYKLSSISSSPQQLSEDIDSYILHIAGLEIGEWVYTAKVETEMKDGIYQADIITERVAPISFILN